MRCEFPHKRKYCEETGKDPDEDVVMLIDSLDEILYNANDFERGGFHHESDEEASYFEREFTLLGGDDSSSVWPLIETKVTVRHIKEKYLNHEQFLIETGWIVHSEGAPKQPYKKNYSIELWPGTVAAVITEYDLSTAKMKNKTVGMINRPMVPYDYEVLLNTLAEIDGMQDGLAREKQAFFDT